MKRVGVLIITVGLLLGFSQSVKKKDYIDYHKYFAEIEELIVDENFREAEVKLDSLFEKFEVKFAKDFIIGAQLSVLNNKIDKAISLLIKSTGKGVKLDCLKSISLLNSSLSYNQWRIIEIQSLIEREKYYKELQNQELYIEFHTRYQKEQESKRKGIYREVVYENFLFIKRILEKTGFAGENMIGIDDSRLANKLSDCGVGNSRVIVTLLHYDYPISEIGEERLISAIRNGNLHPRQFATIYNFEKNKVSILYDESEKVYPELSDYKFNFPFGEMTEDISRVNADRESFGICKYEVDKKKSEISKKYGFRFNFNYK